MYYVDVWVRVGSTTFGFGLPVGVGVQVGTTWVGAFECRFVTAQRAEGLREGRLD